MSGLNQMWSFN